MGGGTDLKMDSKDKDSEIPIWPREHEGSKRRMSFLFGEARWYIWLQDENKQSLSSLRRDLLLLHQNGDLKIFRQKNALSAGCYVTALHEGRMIRGRVLSQENRPQDMNSGTIQVIDIDEGRTLQMLTNQVRMLPPEMMLLPSQAIRCDIGLDCEEQFIWPAQINEMLHKILNNAILIVENKSNRPGTIPTISANITVVNPATGEEFNICKWLLGPFSSSLDMCCLYRFRPFPVGMSNNQVGTYFELLQQQMLGMSLQSAPPGFYPPQPQMGLGPMFPPRPALMPYQNYMQPIGMFSPSPTQSPGTTFATSVPPFSPPPPALYCASPPVSLPSLPNGERLCQPSVVDSMKVEYESDSSSSTVAIELEVKSTSSSSMSPTAAALSLRSRFSTVGPSSTEDELEEEPLSCGRGNRRRLTKTERHSSSSSLSADAPPFVPKRSAHTDVKETKVVASSNMQKTNLNATEKTFMNAAKTPQSETTAFTPMTVHQTVGSPKKSPDGKHVELVQVLREWKVGQIVPALIAHVWNPSCLEVNVVDKLSGELVKLEKEMADYYKHNRITISSKQQAKEICGNFCACYDADDDIWFRGLVDEWYTEDSVIPLKVWAVDYGNYLRQDLGSIQPLSTELAISLPILITLCCMKNIVPCSDNGIWPEVHLNRIKDKLPEDKQIDIRIEGPMSKKEIWPVSVFTSKESLESVNEILVAEGLAKYVGSQMTENCSENAIYEDADEDPMEEAFKLGHNNYELDDEDACVAVSGRKPTDEKGICWNYNRDGYCYKKICELKHVKLDPEGHSIAKEETYIRPFTELNEHVLAPGKVVRLKVSRILTVHHFMALLRLDRGTEGIHSRETLSSVLQNLNSTEMKRSLKRFDEYPADGEIVLAKDKTGIFFRGRVLSSAEADDNFYEVLNVDTGVITVIALQDLRRVDPAFLHHPFQAVECWLADVSPIECDREWIRTANTVLADLVNKKTMTATIIRSDPWGLEVNLYDKDGQSIAEILKDMGLVKNCPMRHLPSTQSQWLPG